MEKKKCRWQINTLPTPYHQDLARLTLMSRRDAQGREAASRASIERRVSETKDSSLVMVRHYDWWWLLEGMPGCGGMPEP